MVASPLLRRFPEPETLALAVVDDELALTYQELEERANRLARHLIAMGVGPDSRVGVSVERSAGMVEDARPTVVLIQKGIDGLVSAGSGEPLRRPVPDTALSYLLFTSGSTGPGDRVLRKAPFGFDASMWEFLGALVLLIASFSLLNPRLRGVESNLPDAVPSPRAQTPVKVRPGCRAPEVRDCRLEHKHDST